MMYHVLSTSAAAVLQSDFCIRYFFSSAHATNIYLDIEPLVQRFGHVAQSLVDIPVVDTEDFGSL